MQSPIRDLIRYNNQVRKTDILPAFTKHFMF